MGNERKSGIFGLARSVVQGISEDIQNVREGIRVIRALEKLDPVEQSASLIQQRVARIETTVIDPLERQEQLRELAMDPDTKRNPHGLNEVGVALVRANNMSSALPLFADAALRYPTKKESDRSSQQVVRDNLYNTAFRLNTLAIQTSRDGKATLAGKMFSVVRDSMGLYLSGYSEDADIKNMLETAERGIEDPNGMPGVIVAKTTVHRD